MGQEGDDNMVQTQETHDRSSVKTARFEARLTDEQKALFLRASEILGSSLTDFVIASAYENATRTVREHETLMLSARDRKAFITALLAVPAPAARLRKAVRHYRKRQRLSVDAG